MRKLSLKEIEIISANGKPTSFQCYASGIAVFTGGLATILAVPYVVNCWNS